MPLLGDKEVKAVKNKLTPNKLLTRLCTNKSWKILTQIKKWNQANTVCFISAYNQVNKIVYNNLIKLLW